MKRMILAAIVIAVLAGCAGTQNLSPEKAKRQAETAQKVSEGLKKQRYTIEVNHVYPQRMHAKALSYGYYIKVSGDPLYSYLPYFGHAYRVPYGGGKGLDFAEKMTEYTITKGKGGRMNIDIKVDNREDRYTYHLEVYDNGRAFLDVSSDERDRIGFSGMMDVGR